jgi:hypothetical protein
LTIYPCAYGGPDEKGEVALVLSPDEAAVLARELQAAVKGGSAYGG